MTDYRYRKETGHCPTSTEISRWPSVKMLHVGQGAPVVQLSRAVTKLVELSGDADAF